MFDINDASVYDDNYTLLSKIRKILKSLSNLTDRVTALENGGGGGGGSVGDFQNKLYGQVYSEEEEEFISVPLNDLDYSQDLLQTIPEIGSGDNRGKIPSAHALYLVHQEAISGGGGGGSSVGPIGFKHGEFDNSNKFVPATLNHDDINANFADIYGGEYVVNSTTIFSLVNVLDDTDTISLTVPTIVDVSFNGTPFRIFTQNGFLVNITGNATVSYNNISVNFTDANDKKWRLTGDGQFIIAWDPTSGEIIVGNIIVNASTITNITDNKTYRNSSGSGQPLYYQQQLDLSDIQETHFIKYYIEQSTPE